MRKLFFILFIFSLNSAIAQSTKYDDLKKTLLNSENDSAKFFATESLFFAYVFSYPDSSLIYVKQEIELANRQKSNFLLSYAYNDYSTFYTIIGDYPQAFNYAQLSLRAAKRSKNFAAIALAYAQFSPIFIDEEDYKQALKYSLQAKDLMEKNWRVSYILSDTSSSYFTILLGLGTVYELTNELDSANKYISIANNAYRALFGKSYSATSFEFGNIYQKRKNYPEAIKYYRQGIKLSMENDVKKDLMDNCNGLAQLFKSIQQPDSAIAYANKVLEVSKSAFYIIGKLKALNILADIYKSQNNIDSIAKYLELTIAVKNNLFSQQKLIQLQNLTYNEEIRQQEEIREQEDYKNKLKLYVLVSASAIFFLIVVILYRNNRLKQKAYVLLQKQKKETDFQKQKTEAALENLKATQQQLIQSEKMASLGELTAGIAHEIQNPLNFVNNFSEVNREMLEELKAERLKPRAERDEQTEDVIIDDVLGNEDKINHHGKRADAIVKGMLQHSRKSEGKKEPTDINALCDEYLRLSFHGLRAKDKTFNADYKTDFDESIGKINIVPQDIGRVLLNLYNNAFYAVNEKKKQMANGYQPLVEVKTRRINDKIEIVVSDNGNGIPQNIIDKIFQPFFTTKPTGEGTGLGLSLSYDIITKEHNGTIKVESKEGEGSEFVITLPA